MSDVASEDLLVIVLISAQRVSATVAVLNPQLGERVVAHKAIECRWSALSERGQQQTVAEVLRLAEDSAGVQAWSVFLCRSGADYTSREVVGWCSVGEETTLTDLERSWALRRAREQVTGGEREVLDVHPVQWTVRGRGGEREVEDPVGQSANHLTCRALLVTARRGFGGELAALAAGLKLDLDGVIAEPLALYRGIANRLPKRGSSLVIDLGASHTSILVRRRERLVHIETHAFGGDDLTRVIAEATGLDEERAEDLKRELDIALPLGGDPAFEGQQHIFAEIQERHRLVAPAVRACTAAVEGFFRARADDLRGNGWLAQQGDIHLVGRAAALGGLAVTLREIFELPVVLGTGDRSRQPGDELDALAVTGMVRMAADQRRERIRGQSSSIRKTASGLWNWLTKRME